MSYLSQTMTRRLLPALLLANRASQLRPVVLAPTPGNQVGEWKSPITTATVTNQPCQDSGLIWAAPQRSSSDASIRPRIISPVP